MMVTGTGRAIESRPYPDVPPPCEINPIIAQMNRLNACIERLELIGTTFGEAFAKVLRPCEPEVDCNEGHPQSLRSAHHNDLERFANRLETLGNRLDDLRSRCEL